MSVRIEDEALGLLLLLLVICVGILFFKSPGTSDVRLFMIWMAHIREDGLVAGYAANETVQMPLYAVFFWVVTKAAQWVGTTNFIAYKYSLLLAWLLTGLCLRQWTRSRLAISLALLALIPSTMALGYFDIYLAPFLLLALWAAREKYWWLFSASFAAGALTKAQALILAPFAAVFVLKVIWSTPMWRQATRVALALTAPAAVIVGLLLGVFGTAMNDALHVAVDTQHLSGNALNLCWVVTHYIRSARPDLYGPLNANGVAEFIWRATPDRLYFWMRVIFFIFYGLILITYANGATSFRHFIYYSLLGYLGYFVLNTGVHENHLFLAAIFSRVLGIDLAVVFAGLNVVFFVVVVAPVFWGQLPTRRCAI